MQEVKINKKGIFLSQALLFSEKDYHFKKML